MLKLVGFVEISQAFAASAEPVIICHTTLMLLAENGISTETNGMSSPRTARCVMTCCTVPVIAAPSMTWCPRPKLGGATSASCVLGVT